MEREVHGSTGTDAGRVQTSKFDGSTAWPVFHHQQTMAGHYKWAPCIKAMHLLAAQWGQASDALHGVPREVTYEETIKALDNCFGDQHLAKAHCSQLNTRTQVLVCPCKSLPSLLNSQPTASILHYLRITKEGSRQGIPQRCRRPRYENTAATSSNKWAVGGNE